MADLTLGPWTKGIDHLSPDTSLPAGAVKDAINVDFDRAGTARRRPGYALLGAGRFHSLWTSRITGQSFVVQNGVLSLVTTDGIAVTLTTVYTLSVNERVSYDHLNGEVLFCNRHEIGVISNAGVARLLGVEDPGAVGVTANATVGGMRAGRYAVGITFLRGTEESGLSYGTFCTIPEGGGLSLDLPQPAAADVTGIRIYRTEANGDVFYRATDVPLALTPYLLGNGLVGRQANTHEMSRMRGGQIVRYWRGRVFVARGSVLNFSQAMRYGLTDPRHDFVQYPSRITLMEPTLGGVFVGTREGVVYHSGNEISAWEWRRTGAKPPIEGTGTQIDAAEVGELGEGLDKRDESYALWLSANGFCIGSTEGRIYELQGSRIRLPVTQLAGVGAVVVHERRAIAVIN